MLDLVLGIPPDRFCHCQIQHWSTMLSLDGVSHILCLLIICKLLSVFLAYCFMKNVLFLFLHSQGHQKSMMQEDVTPYRNFAYTQTS